MSDNAKSQEQKNNLEGSPFEKIEKDILIK